MFLDCQKRAIEIGDRVVYFNNKRMAYFADVTGFTDTMVGIRYIDENEYYRFKNVISNKSLLSLEETNFIHTNDEW